MQPYRRKLRIRPKAAIPSIISTSAALMIVDRILTMLRLSSLLTQAAESRRPASARMMLQIAQTLRMLSGRVSFSKTGTRANEAAYLSEQGS